MFFFFNSQTNSLWRDSLTALFIRETWAAEWRRSRQVGVVFIVGRQKGDEKADDALWQEAMNYGDIVQVFQCFLFLV